SSSCWRARCCLGSPSPEAATGAQLSVAPLSVAPLSLAPRLTGVSVKRVEDSRLLVGSGAYLDDFRLPGLLHAAFVRSVHAHARVRGVGLESARRAPGVAAALSGRDLSEWVK